jgi:octaprenyl-diphosphate synthase
MERRGFFSINAIWKNKIAVLVGDYLLSKGLLLSTSNNEFEQLHIMSDAIRQMSEGELLQMEKTRKLNITEDIYFEILKNKTASLLSSACGVGAYSTTQNKAITEQMKLFGEKTGIAFQIKDDLFDYGKDDIGKPTGNDIKEKKMTLPLIYTLNNVDNKTMRDIIYIVKNNNTDKQKVKWVIDTVVKTGGITYAEKKMKQYRDEAIAILDQYPTSEVSNALKDLVRFTTDRKF